MNKLITNLTSSVLDLSVIKDLNGNTVTLRPAGGPGCSREVAAEAARHDAVERCIDMKWVSVTLIAAANAPAPVETPPAPPASEIVFDGPPEEGEKFLKTVAGQYEATMTKETSVVETKTEEPVVETKPEEPVVEEPKAEETPAAEETKSDDRSRRRHR